MKKILTIAGMFALLSLSGGVLAGQYHEHDHEHEHNQNHECQGSNNCNESGEGDNSDATPTISIDTGSSDSNDTASRAYAPALTSSNDTCMGSTSMGAQGLLIGISFGTTWTDNDCITRKDARFIHNTGHRTVALSLMFGKESVRAAVARAGTPEQRAACSITDAEIDSYRAKPIVVSVDRVAPSSDEDED